MTGEPRIIGIGEELPPLEPAATVRTNADVEIPETSPAQRRSTGRWQTLNHFCDFTAHLLRPLAACVWIQLFRNAKPDGLVRISQGELARRVGKTPRSVRSALRQLEAAGVVCTARRGSLRGGASTYRIRARKEKDP